VALHGDGILVAMAGLHQIWIVQPEEDVARVWAGTGHEASRDGPRQTAWFAQPMGLTMAKDALYVACAEAQAIRRIDLHTDEVTTLCGGGLFDFGDVDGTREDALLQHCQDVAVVGGSVYVADTYNNKIKLIDSATGRVETFAGSGTAGALDGPKAGARFAQPSGVAGYDRVLYIADTDNHLIRTCDLDDGHVRTLGLSGLTGSQGA
jgi:DNA-binding beta-propeller fold protein YncE